MDEERAAAIRIMDASFRDDGPMTAGLVQLHHNPGGVFAF